MERVDIGWIDPGYVNSYFAHSVAAQAIELEKAGVLGGIHASTNASLLTTARNSLVQGFLKTGHDWLWMVDSDMQFENDHVQKLLAMAHDTGADMVSGLAFIWRSDQGVVVPSIFYDGDGSFEGELITKMTLPENGEEVAATGLATALVHRKVFLGMTGPRHEDYRWFDQIIMPSGNMSGEDVQFFYRARERGFTLRINTEADTVHLKEMGVGRAEYDAQMETIELV